MSELSNKRLGELISGLESHGGSTLATIYTADYLRALTELRSLRSSAGVVKALEWVGDEAETPFGKYRLYRTDDGYGLSFNYDELVHVGFNSVGTFESAQDKAASYAQPHFTAAILSALTPAYTPNAEQVTITPRMRSVAGDLGDGYGLSADQVLMLWEPLYRALSRSPEVEASTDAMVDRLEQAINEAMEDAEIDYPVGYHKGMHRISWDGDALRTALLAALSGAK